MIFSLTCMDTAHTYVTESDLQSASFLTNAYSTAVNSNAADMEAAMSPVSLHNIPKNATSPAVITANNVLASFRCFSHCDATSLNAVAAL